MIPPPLEQDVSGIIDLCVSTKLNAICLRGYSRYGSDVYQYRSVSCFIKNIALNSQTLRRLDCSIVSNTIIRTPNDNGTDLLV